MECPRRWAVLCNLLFFLIQTANVYCQIEPLEEISTNYQQRDSKRDVRDGKLFIPSSKILTNTQDDRSRTLNVISQSPTYYSQDGVFGQSDVQLILKPQCSISLPESSCNSVPRIPLENYANMVQPASTVWQSPQPSNDVYGYPVNLQINSPSPNVPTQPGIIEFLSEINGGALLQEPILVQNGYEDGLPVNLQINIPAQNLQGPRITVVSAAPSPLTSANSDTVLSFPQFPPPLPIIRKSRSNWKNLLPILLIALLSEQDCCCNGCCCCCNCNSDSPIPIPFPIPIPVNNPIINNDESSYSPRNRGHRDNEGGDGNN